MKTLAQPRDKAEIARRLKTLTPESAGRWGRMSVHQMVCHLSDSFRILSGEKAASSASGPLKRTIVKWIALRAPMRWPVGVVATRPEIDQHIGGTTPVEFADDLADLEALLELVTTRRDLLQGKSHPVFGRLSEAEWLRWGYLHMDHHLRQFGL